MQRISLNIEYDTPDALLRTLLNLAETVQVAAGGPPLAEDGGANIALFTTEELQAELTRRLNGSQQFAMEGVAAAPTPKKRGRPPKAAAPEVLPGQGNLFAESEQPPDPAALPNQTEIPDTGTGGVASTGPDQLEMERLISAVFSRSKDMERLRKLMLEVTGFATLNKSPKETWPRLKQVLEAELVDLNKKVG